MNMSAWQSLQERILLGAAASALALVFLVNLRLPLPTIFDSTVIAQFLCSDVTVTIASDLLIGFISAYIFYVVIDLIPRHRKEQSILRVLNLLVASIVEAYEVYGHETAITSIDLSVLKESRLNKHLEDFGHPQVDILKLKFAMETAHSRYPDFQHSLGLAAALSPEIALKWLVLSDKVRLLADVYSTFDLPSAVGRSSDAPFKSEKSCPQSFIDLKATLQLRVKEVMEASAHWKKLTTEVMPRS
jgi:hypothetical protein